MLQVKFLALHHSFFFFFFSRQHDFISKNKKPAIILFLRKPWIQTALYHCLVFIVMGCIVVIVGDCLTADLSVQHITRNSATIYHHRRRYGKQTEELAGEVGGWNGEDDRVERKKETELTELVWWRREDKWLIGGHGHKLK